MENDDDEEDDNNNDDDQEIDERDEDDEYDIEVERHHIEDNSKSIYNEDANTATTTGPRKATDKVRRHRHRHHHTKRRTSSSQYPQQRDGSLISMIDNPTQMSLRHSSQHQQPTSSSNGLQGKLLVKKKGKRIITSNVNTTTIQGKRYRNQMGIFTKHLDQKHQQQQQQQQYVHHHAHHHQSTGHPTGDMEGGGGRATGANPSVGEKSSITSANLSRNTSLIPGQNNTVGPRTFSRMFTNPFQSYLNPHDLPRTVTMTTPAGGGENGVGTILIDSSHSSNSVQNIGILGGIFGYFSGTSQTNHTNNNINTSSGLNRKVTKTSTLLKKKGVALIPGEMSLNKAKNLVVLSMSGNFQVEFIDLTLYNVAKDMKVLNVMMGTTTETHRQMSTRFKKDLAAYE
jgi:hypothetical protein